MNEYNFKGIIFEGAGPAGLGHVGVIKVLGEHQILDNLTHFVGSSSGSFAAMSLACGASVEYIEKEMMDLNFSDLLENSKCILKHVNRMRKEYGWYSADGLEAYAGKILNHLSGKADLTFGEAFERFGTFLEITITDLNTGNIIYASHLNHPEMEIKVAIRRSASIPLFFACDTEKVMSGIKHYYADGGTINNYPIKRLDTYLDRDQVIGSKLMTSSELKMNDEMLFPKGPKNFIEFSRVIYAILRNQALKIHIEENDWKRTIAVDIGEISSLNFNLSEDEKNFLIKQGRNAAIKFLSKFNQEDA